MFPGNFVEKKNSHKIAVKHHKLREVQVYLQDRGGPPVLDLQPKFIVKKQ